MENKNKKYLIPLMVALAFVIGVLSVNASRSVGGVATGQAYISTTTDSTHTSGTISLPLCLGSSIFGSIVVNQVGTAGYVRVWDATSTASSTYSLTRTATYGREIAKVTGASDAAGTLTYDTQALIGVVVETSTGFDGQYTVTCKR